MPASSSVRLFAAAVAAFAAAGPAASAPAHGWDMQDMDPSCPACSDFYRYANGGWLDRNAIPAERTRWSSYEEVSTRTQAELEAIVADARAEAGRGGRSIKGKIGLFYETCMDEQGAERAGLAPITADLAALDALTARSGLQPAIQRVKLVSPDLLFWADLDADPGGSGRNILTVQQSGLSLPEPGLYLEDGPDAAKARDQLLASVQALLALAGETPQAAGEDAARILALETALARAFVAAADTRDPHANYNPMGAAAAQSAVTPHFDWAAYLASDGADPAAVINVAQPQFFRALDHELAERPLEDWRAYLKWQLVKAAAPWLSKPFADAAFQFDSAMNGAKAQPSREKRCLAALGDNMGEALGRLYYDRNFTEDSRRRGEAMVANLKAAMGERIRGLTWMSAPTRAEALKKLARVEIYIGGPNSWIDYTPLQVEPGPFFDNVRRAEAFAIRREAAQLGKPVDRARWYKLPQDYSGGADLTRNTFMYPAGKFQAPFFDPLADDALNYGALGATMGHELVHLFDDRGRQYDAEGALRDWWTPADAAHFKEQAELIRRQFDGFTFQGQPVNGALTLSENIADLGGLTVAYHALERSLAGKPGPRIDGFTPEQRFFLAWARNFRTLIRPERARTLLRTDPHAPDPLRVNGPLSNMPEFADAFGCRASDAMVRPLSERARIW